MADERPPVGGDASDFETAAKAKLAEAKNTRSKVTRATRATKEAKGELTATERSAEELIRERDELEKRRKKVAHRLRSASRRLEANELSTPANQARIESTYQRHLKELGDIEQELGRVESEQARVQAAREAPQVRDRITMTPRQREAKARRLEREAKIAAARAAPSGGDERPPAEGSFEELERVAREQNARMAAALDPAGRRRLAQRQAPVTSPAAQAQGRAELEGAKTANRSQLYQRLADALAKRVAQEEAMAQAEEQARFAAKVEREKERRLRERAVRAEARRQQMIEESRAGAPRYRQYAQPIGPTLPTPGAPGTDIIRHPTEFGRRVPGPFGQVREPAPIPFPSDRPQPRTREQGPRDVYAQRPRTAASSIGESRGEIAIYRSAAQERAKAARAAQAATRVADAEAERHAQALAEAAHNEQTYAQRLAESEQGMRRWSAQLGVVDQSMRRHGTFTTEFISAAAKGEVAYREWGWQIGAAAAKFGAWTAAGAGIYAVLGSVAQVGQGAIDSASGVDSLKRSLDDVNSAQAQQSFRQQATHFNVPIETVVDAQTRMGAVFHDQADAATAASAALYALQTGQVDVQQSTKDLIAIQQAYGSSAADLVGLFDQLNYVQNNYGARIPDMETGIAAAAGSFKQMGGSMEEAVALFTTLQRFGTTGNIASTIFRRMPNELAKPGNQAVLRQYRIDPSADVLTVVRQAQKAVAGGADPQTIAKALVGGQFAARFQNVLTHPDFLNKVLSELTGGKARGASERELGHVKDEASQAIKSIGIELQALGSNLQQLGFGVVLGTGVKALTETLHLANQILEVFNQWPGPLKTIAAYAVTAAAGLAGARRLGIGGALEGTRAAGLAPYLIESDPRRTRRLVGKGLADAVKFSQNEQERLSSEAFRAAADRNRMARAEGEIVADTNARLAANSIDEVTAAERRNAAAAATAAAAHKAQVAGHAANAAIEQAADQYRLRAEFDALMAKTARRDRDAVAQQFAAQQGLFIRPSLGADVPAAERVRQVGAEFGPYGAYSRGGQIGPAARTAASVGPPRSVGPPGAAQAAAQAAALGSTIGAFGQRDQAKRALPQVREAMGKLTANFRATQAEAGAMAAASQAAGVAARGAAIGLTAVGTGIRGLFLGLNAMMGPIGWAIAGLTLLPSIISAIQEFRRKTKEATRTPSTTELPDTKASLDQFKKNIDRQTEEAKGFSFGKVLENLDPRNFLPHKDPRIVGLEAQRRAAEKREAEVEKARKEGRPVAGRSGQQILEESQRDVDEYKRGKIDLNELRKREELRLKEILVAGAKGKGASPGRAKQLEQEIKDLFDQADEKIVASIDSRFNLLDSLTDDPLEKARLRVQRAQALLAEARKGGKQDDINNALAEVNNANRAEADALKEDAEKRLAALGALVESGSATRGQVQSYIAQQAALVNQLRGSTNPEDMQKYANARQALLGALTNAGKSELDAALANARTPAQVEKAYRDYERAGRAAERTAMGATRPDPSTQPLASLRSGLGGIRGSGPAPGEQVDKGLAAQIRAIRRQRAQEVFEAKAELQSAQTAVQAGRTEAGVPRLELQLSTIHRQVIGAIKAYGRQSKRTLELIAQEQQAQAALIQGQAALIDAEAGYAAAQAGTNQTAAGRARLAGLERKLALAQQHPEIEGLGDRASLLGLQAQILEARTALAETARQEANDLLDAQYALRASRNDDPVYQARLEAQRTAAIVRRGGFSSPADRLRAQADANNALRNARDAAVQAKMEDIDFDVEIGKITVQQQIARYEELLKTSKMGQQQKKELKRQIERLRHEAETGSEDFSLDVGNIRLPSVYEVHRAIREGRDARGRTVVNNSPTVNVNVAPGDDGSGVIRALDNYLGTSARSAMRAAADIGV